jgi:hypothetical protein
LISSLKYQTTERSTTPASARAVLGLTREKHNDFPFPDMWAVEKAPAAREKRNRRHRDAYGGLALLQPNA